MNELYNKAKMAWGICMPRSLKALRLRDDEHVTSALWDVMNDITSPTWTIDTKIAWALLQGREVEE